jgi:two-component system, chemotaxis family, response regulator Rcp1
VADTPIDILLVEDNEMDILLFEDAQRRNGLQWRLNVARDGVEAMDYLRGLGSFAGSPRPSLILLDLKMPRKDGRQVLGEIRADPVLRCIPVIVLTSSDAPDDVMEAYRTAHRPHHRGDRTPRSAGTGSLGESRRLGPARRSGTTFPGAD